MVSAEASWRAWCARASCAAPPWAPPGGTPAPGARTRTRTAAKGDCATSIPDGAWTSTSARPSRGCAPAAAGASTRKDPSGAPVRRGRSWTVTTPARTSTSARRRRTSAPTGGASTRAQATTACATRDSSPQGTQNHYFKPSRLSFNLFWPPCPFRDQKVCLDTTQGSCYTGISGGGVCR